MPKSKTERVAQRLLDRIIEDGVVSGSSLGTEAELLAQFRVSRPTLREALRILDSQGVLELRPGPGGGIVVRKPRIDTLTRGLSVFLRLRDVPYSAVLKTREIIEPALAAEAAANGSDEDFGQMQDSIERMKEARGNQHAFVAENGVFHGLVARASGNEVMEIFWATIGDGADGEQVGIKYSQTNMQHVIRAHQGIVDACQARNPAAAYATMKAHVAELEHLVRKRYEALLTSPRTNPETPRRTATAAR